MKSGKYEVLALGHDNEATPMTVTIENDRLKEIKIDEAALSPFAKEVFTTVPDEILRQQSLNVDAVSGASQSSCGIIQGVADAIKQAGGDPADFTATAQTSFTGFKPGSYSSSTDSIYGPVTVSVTVDQEKLTDLQVTEIHDTPGVGRYAAEILPERILVNNSVNVDAVSGATLTSMALISSVKKALKQASPSLPATMTKPVPFQAPAQADFETDLLVIGGGIAGMSALQQASRAGLKTALVERNAFLGGDALVSGQYYTISDFDDEIINHHEIAKTYQEEGLNIKLSQVVLGLGTFDTFAIAEDPDANGQLTPGTSSTTLEIVKILEKDALAHGAKILVNNKVDHLLIEDGKVTGAVVTPKGQASYQIRAKGIILATGGFANNPEMVAEYLPHLAGAQYEGMPGSQGDAIKWTKSLGLKTDMPTRRASFYPANPTSGVEAMLWSEIHFIDKTGKLIENGTYYNKTSMQVYEKLQNKHYYLLITDKEAKLVKDAYNEGVKRGEFMHFDNAAAAKQALDLPNLDKTLTYLDISLDEPFYINEAVSIIYGTYTGLNTNLKGQVLQADGTVFPNLYAVGEVRGSLSYRKSGYYDGGLASGLVWGFKAGQQAGLDLL